MRRVRQSYNDYRAAIFGEETAAEQVLADSDLTPGDSRGIEEWLSTRETTLGLTGRAAYHERVLSELLDVGQDDRIAFGLY